MGGFKVYEKGVARNVRFIRGILSRRGFREDEFVVGSSLSLLFLEFRRIRIVWVLVDWVVGAVFVCFLFIGDSFCFNFKR